MDLTSIGGFGGVAGIVSLVVVVIEKVYQLLNHKRIRSNCCGMKGELSLDIDSTTPEDKRNSLLLHKPLIVKENAFRLTSIKIPGD